MEKNNEIYTAFSEWLDGILKNSEMPAETKAYCFNLYEESVEDSVYGVQLIAADEFDEDDWDWACSEVWSSGEDIFCVELSDEKEKDWKAAESLIKGWTGEYLNSGKYGGILREKPVGIGFVDGDLSLIKNK